MRRSRVIALWLVFMAACAGIAARASYTADLTAFLPPSRTPNQELMLAQLRDGVAARLVLIGLEGAPEASLAATSRALAAALRSSGDFKYVANGAVALTRRDRDILIAHRYLLSPGVSAEAFSEAGLRAALERAADLLGSPAGTLLRPMLPRDPTGEMPRLAAAFGDRNGPPLRDGVWFDPARSRAVLMAETRMPGYELDAQAKVQAGIREAFASVRANPDVRITMTGPSVFAVQSRAAIERDAWRLSAFAGAGVALVLFAAYRRMALVALGALPVATGMLAGIAAVGALHGSVHGITLGFGATLIGEAADYSTYLFAQRARGESLDATAARVWPTLRLAVLTTVFGSLAMLASSFAGLAQLGLLTFVGALAAGLATRHVLPALVPTSWAVDAAPDVPAPAALAHAIGFARRLAWTVPLAFAAAVAVLAARHAVLWQNDLADLAPIAAADQLHDQELREALGAPDVRHLMVVSGASPEDVLRRLEQLAPELDALVANGEIRGYDSAARYLPSADTQRRRQAALPPPEVLSARLDAAARDSPFREGLFAPFLADVAAARTASPLTLADVEGTAFGLAAGSLLFELNGRWVGLIPLSGVVDAGRLARSEVGRPAEVTLLDLKAESDAMVSGYREQSLALSGAGVLVIAVVLAIGLRSTCAVTAVMLPVLAAIAVTAAFLVVAGTRLSQLHLVSLLLVLGIGTNYSLFFSRFVADSTEGLRNAYAVLVATSTTLIAFGALALSGTAILGAIGKTVTLGAALSFLFAAAWSRPQP